MAFTLEQLRGFVAVADELHFGRAAARLKMTQPPLSRQIQKLERVGGAQLLERDNRRVTLTAAGQVFLVEARRLLGLADSAPELARRVSSGASGVVRIGFTAASTYGILGRLLNDLAQELPDVDVDLAEMVTREQVAGLLNEEVDLGLGRPPFDEDAFGHRLLHREALLVAAPMGHRLLELGRPVTAADLASTPVVMHSPTQAKYFYDLVAGGPRCGPVGPKDTIPVTLLPPDALADRLKSGLLSFPVTHFDADLQFDEPRYREHLAWQAGFDVAGLFAAGGTGEGFSLTPPEIDQVVRTAVSEVGDRNPNLIGFKDGVGDIERLPRIYARLGDRLTYIGGLPTAETFALPLLELGVSTYSSALYNFVPEFALRFYAAVRRQDRETVYRLLSEFVIPYLDIRDRGKGYAVSIIKAGLTAGGPAGGGGGPPPP